MPRPTPVLLLLVSAPLGCMRSLDVRHSTPMAAKSKAARLPGIPFYAKTGVCQQQTIWLEPQYVLTFQSDSATGQTTLSAAQYRQNAVQMVIAKPSAAGWETLLLDNPPQRPTDEAKSTAVKDQQGLGNWQLVANTAAIIPIVDYNHVYYLNSARPLAGSAQVATKLNPDGTLSEGSAQVEDKTLSTIVTALGSLATTAATAGAMAVRAESTAVTISVIPHFYLHTHTLISAPGAPIECKVIAAGVFDGSITVTEPATAAKPADPNSISVSGTVKLPTPQP